MVNARTSVASRHLFSHGLRGFCSDADSRRCQLSGATSLTTQHILLRPLQEGSSTG